MQTEVTQFYEDLSTIYLAADRRREDRAREFRTKLEKVLKVIVNTDAPLLELCNQYYQFHGQRGLKDLTHTLRKSLNDIVHGSVDSINQDELDTIYQDLIRSIHSGTRIIPPVNVLRTINMHSDSILDELNERQKAAVLLVNPIVFVNAGPGTGKTHLIVHKIYHTVIHAQGEEAIVALSYTNAAANELQTKIFRNSLFDKGKKYTMASGTIHSYLYRTLREFALFANSDAFNFILLDEEEFEFFAEEAMNTLQVSCTKKEVVDFFMGKPVNTLDESIMSSLKDYKTKFKVISFRDLHTIFLRELNTNNVFAAWYKSKVTLLVVDEAQDLTAMDFKLFELIIAHTACKVFLVGDPRQSIFRFNDGSYAHLQAFLSNYPNQWAEAVLDQSYRCPKSVFDKANNLSFLDCVNYPMHSEKDATYDEIQYFEHTNEEAAFITQKIHELKNFRDIAVISPSLKSLITLARLLNDQQIPFKATGGRHYLKKHIRFCFHLLNVLRDASNAYSWKFLYNRLSPANQRGETDVYYSNEVLKYLSGTEIKRAFSGTNEKTMSTPLILTYLLSEQDTALFAAYFRMEAAAWRTDIEALISMANESDSTNDFQMKFSLGRERFARFFDKDFDVESVCEDLSNAVTLSTIHSAKGLQWKHVIIPGLAEGLLPNPYFCEPRSKPQEEWRLLYNDERKKLYVALTRAELSLLITVPRSYSNQGGTWECRQSRFLEEMGVSSF